MNKLLLLLFPLFFLFGSPKPSAGLESPAANVYVCVSTTSVAYHNQKSCRGLNRCTHQVVTVSEEKAVKEYGKRKCLICY
ncbi:hypothetical protein V9K67_19770 [Paraflavisolibacter sp. H34]|uniref:hypothetical protein n=1 Tax=Huijunlia imazamoxiresistens TaxID=3127457 RepID=UPI003019A1C2